MVRALLLWLNKSKAGESYFSGSLGVGGKVLIFKNNHKGKDSDPDYQLYLVPKPQKEEAEKLDPDAPF